MGAVSQDPKYAFVTNSMQKDRKGITRERLGKYFRIDNSKEQINGRDRICYLSL